MSITKPANLTGCNPEIKKAIKAGLLITCYVSDYNENRRNRKADILAFVRDEEDEEHQYLDSDGLLWAYATPLKPPEKWIMPPEKAIPILIREGWKFDMHGDLAKKVGSVHSYFLYHGKFCHFGSKLSEVPMGDYWAFISEEFKCIIEEK